MNVTEIELQIVSILDRLTSLEFKQAGVKREPKENKMKHKHAEFIKAWANGDVIEIFSTNYNEWIVVDSPAWCEGHEYRIKPEPKPDVVSYAFIDTFSYDCSFCLDLDRSIVHNVKFIWDGETGKLKSAEIIE
jgi:hypothetical protein